MARRAVPKDAAALLPLVRAYRVFYGQEPNPELEREFIEGHLRKHTSVIYIAEVDRHAAGFIPHTGTTAWQAHCSVTRCSTCAWTAPAACSWKPRTITWPRRRSTRRRAGLVKGVSSSTTHR